MVLSQKSDGVSRRLPAHILALMQAHELNDFLPSEMADVQDGELEPWGGLGESLEWADKERHIGIRDDDGRLLALAGLLTASVAVDKGRSTRSSAGSRRSPRARRGTAAKVFVWP